MRRFAWVLFALLAGGCSLASGSPVPPWDHIVVVILENHSASQVRDLPTLSALASQGRVWQTSRGVARPSQPNYLALFSGSTHGVKDNLHHDLLGPTLQSRLEAAGYRFTQWAQSLPSAGFRGDAYPYLRKHTPAASWAAVAAGDLLPLSQFPTDYTRLPHVSFVTPDMQHDMHDDSPAHSDAWLGTWVLDYAQWASSHRSLLIVTFDEPDTGLGASLSAPIYTVLVGQGIVPGTTAQPITHYTVLKYLLDSFGLAPLGLDLGEPRLDVF